MSETLTDAETSADHRYNTFNRLRNEAKRRLDRELDLTIKFCIN